MKRMKLFYLTLGILLISSCNQASSLPTQSATEPQPEPMTLLSTATSEAQIPADWATYSSQQCEYVISYPSEMQLTKQNPYSELLSFQTANPDDGARNFLYVSVVAPEIQNLVKAGVYNHEVYNYDPAATEILVNMQVGESKSVHASPNMDSGFTFLRKPDTTIDDLTAQAYENARPWEFPEGTKEIRYILSRNGCVYLIGGYMDTTGSNQPGAITADLFHQIIGTVQLMP
jgi:hypothetical protein